MSPALRALLGFVAGAAVSAVVFAAWQLPARKARRELLPPAVVAPPIFPERVEAAVDIARLEKTVQELEMRAVRAPEVVGRAAEIPGWRTAARTWARELGRAAKEEKDAAELSPYQARLLALRSELAFDRGLFDTEVDADPEIDRLAPDFLEGAGLPLDAGQTASLNELLSREDAAWSEYLERRNGMTALERHAESYRLASVSDAAIRAFLTPEQWEALREVHSPRKGNMMMTVATGIVDPLIRGDNMFDATRPEAAARLAAAWALDLLLPGRSPDVLLPFVEDFLRRLGGPNVVSSNGYGYVPSADRARNAAAQAAVQRAMMEDTALTEEEREKVRQWLEFYDPAPRAK